MTQGPKINPKNVVYTGSLFGKGCYFAPRAKKSIGYTSLSGSYWKSGNADRAYLMVYKVAYKNALHLDGDSKKSGMGGRAFTAENIKPHDAVYAHKGYLMGHNAPLCNDEVIAYDEAAIDLIYVIEMRAA
jgi:poly [ADP-ribose] polymerase